MDTHKEQDKTKPVPDVNGTLAGQNAEGEHDSPDAPIIPTSENNLHTLIRRSSRGHCSRPATIRI